ncbi:ADP-ribosylation factor-like protein [Candidatus Harpocratesius sp.]
MALEKIALLGLDNAGKTSIIHILRGDYQSYFNNIPTTNIEHYFSEFLGNHLIISDYPGQIHFREFIIQDEKSELNNVELAILVIDIQDEERFRENIHFLDQLIKNSNLSHLQRFSIFFHKFDEPDSPEYNKIVSSYQKKIIDLFNSKEFKYQFFNTSIKHPISIISAFSDPIFDEMEYRQPVKMLLRNFASNWKINEIFLFTSNFYQVGAIFSEKIDIDRELNNQILFYLQKIDESLNIINELEININDCKIYFSKFFIKKKGKTYPLYVVWKSPEQVSLEMKNSINVLKKTMKLLISPGIEPDPIYV